MFIILHFSLFIFYLFQTKKSIFISLPVYYHFASFYTLLGTTYFNYAQYVPFDFFERVKLSSLESTSYFFSLAAFFFYLGVIITKNSRKNKVGLDFSVLQQLFKSVKNGQILAVYIILIVIFHLGHGLDHIYYREGYLIGDSGVPVLRTIYTILLPFSLILLAFYRGHIVRTILLFFLFFLVLGSSSRNMILIPACYYFGYLIRSNKIKISHIIFIIVFIVILSAVAMQYRYNLYQGAVPNIINLFTHGIDTDLILFAVNYIVSFSYIASALTIQDFSIDFKAFYMSINPMPSRFIDVSYMVENQKININAPFTALGVLAQAGWGVLCLYYFLIGFIFSKCGGDIIKNTRVTALFIYVLFFLFTLLSLQYNLRSVTRLVYYLVIFWGVISLVRVLLCRRSS